MASVHTSEAPSISLFEKREELRWVLESKFFANSPKKTRFLEFVSEQAFLGNGEKLNEYLIGVEVYDRGVDFDPQKDPIVRVQAHDIRRLPLWRMLCDHKPMIRRRELIFVSS